MAAKIGSGSVNGWIPVPVDYRPHQTEYDVNQLVNQLLKKYTDSGKMFCHDIETTTPFGITYVVTTTVEHEGSVDQGRIESVIKDLFGNLLQKTVYLCKNKSFVLEDQEAEAKAEEDEEPTFSDEADAAAAAAGPPEGSPRPLPAAPSGAAAAVAGSPAATGAANDR